MRDPSLVQRASSAPIAEIISIGDEMTSGARLDTNSQWLSVRLEELGFSVAFHTTVGDTLAHNVDVFQIAARRADIIVSSGGLGPTQDDLTREALAAALTVPLYLDERSLAHIESLFSLRGRTMPPQNRVQAMFPIGTTPIDNPQGTAPGVDALIPRPDGTSARVFALPGVPAEMKQMFNHTVAPELLQSGRGTRVIRQNVMKFFGVGESEMEARLGGMISRSRQPRVGITVSSATISLRITAVSESEADCQSMIDATRSEILERVGDLYFGDGESTEQHDVIAEQLRKLQQRLFVVELGYAAPLGDWLASIGPHPALAGGLSLGQFDDLRKLLDAPESWSRAECLLACHSRFGADWLVVVDRYPSMKQLENVQEEDKIVLGVMDFAGRWHETRQNIGGHPSIVHSRIAKHALMFLRNLIHETEKQTET